eukprot:CAMPEP_0119411454 /NCGR_PEP_ID=MMETSP1335-20130426/4197_1 /TAXON_ID=259385 /ORGANISM="Chrysoculter rhomboideus, Strain RCC1486" /LENGTH=56 /DNA_ID=CAMNT_0007436097 /DNA_START=85 /DNA_END=251 /DNA_ORIENTATION=-
MHGGLVVASMQLMLPIPRLALVLLPLGGALAGPPFPCTCFQMCDEASFAATRLKFP